MILGIADVPENSVLVLVIHRLHLGQILKINAVISSVADSGCFISDPGSRFSSSRIPGQKDYRIPDPHPHQRVELF
jgi:hypothetical protein